MSVQFRYGAGIRSHDLLNMGRLTYYKTRAPAQSYLLMFDDPSYWRWPKKVTSKGPAKARDKKHPVLSSDLFNVDHFLLEKIKFLLNYSINSKFYLDPYETTKIFRSIPLPLEMVNLILNKK